jgi:hypothetical protein
MGSLGSMIGKESYIATKKITEDALDKSIGGLKKRV